MQDILGTYQHYKGKCYTVVAIAKDSETLEDIVVYRAEYDHPEFGAYKVWTRKLSDFIGPVTIDNKQYYRFRKLTDQEENDFIMSMYKSKS